MDNNEMTPAEIKAWYESDQPLTGLMPQPFINRLQSFFDEEKQDREKVHFEPGYTIKKGVDGQPDEIKIYEVSICPGAPNQ